MVTRQVLTIALVTLAAASRALAQTPPDGPKVALARQLYNEGREAADRGQWGVAYERFKASYELAPRAVTLYSLSEAMGQTGRLVEASEGYRRFLRETSDGGNVQTRELRDVARSEIERLDKQVARLVLEIVNADPDDAIEVDDTEYPHAVLQQPLPANPGSHVVRIRRGGIALATRTVKLAPGGDGGSGWLHLHDAGRWILQLRVDGRLSPGHRCSRCAVRGQGDRVHRRP